ncbi:MAG: hypothetical protein J0H02_14440 [Armatimonadetes bacterium]|nr:hypothetical protein [Armatimonadota bacterium]
MLATLVLPFILFAPLETKDRPLRNDSTVSFPVGIYTFEEIARRLSTSEFTITSGVPLKLRAALVSLRDRPRSEAIELLEKSLDVKVKPQSDHGGVLTPDDTTAAREKQWRAGVNGQLIARFQKLSRSVYENLVQYQSLNQEDLRQAVTLTGSELDEANEELSIALNPSQSLMDRRDRLVAQSIAAQAMDDKRSSAALHLLNAYLANSPKLLASFTLGPQIVTLSPRDRELLLKAFSDGYPLDQSDGKQIVSVWNAAREPDRIQFSLDLIFGHSNGLTYPLGPSLTTTIPSIVTKRNQSLAAQLLGPESQRWGLRLGEEAKSFFESAKRDTESALRSESLATEVKLEPTKSATTYSELVEAWARETKADVVMELQPLADRLRGPVQGIFYLTKLPWIEDSMSLSYSGEVLMVKNLLSFYDRQYKYPTAPLFSLYRGLTGPRGKKADQIPTWQELSRYFANSDGGAWLAYGTPRIDNYRGMNPAPIETAALTFQVLRYTSSAKAIPSRPGSVVRIDLGGVSSGALRSAVAAAQHLAYDPQLFDPRLANFLTRQSLLLSRNGDGICTAVIERNDAQDPYLTCAQRLEFRSE